MARPIVELDQQINSDIGDGYGTLSIRVVVLSPKAVDDTPSARPSEPDDAEGDLEEPGDENKGPLASYLEKKSYGKWCAVFLVNGQRHHAWDNTFISRDLDFKILRDRTMVIIDLDGLAEEAMSDIMQGSRQGLFEGKVFSAIRDRIIQTLRSNPDLKKLQVEAEQKALDSRTGDAAVKNRLDQLIAGHHTIAEGHGPGGSDLGTLPSDGGLFADQLDTQPVIIMGTDDHGKAGSLPALVGTPDLSAIRIHPEQSKNIIITSTPPEAWSTLEELRSEVVSEDQNLTCTVVESSDQATLTVSFPDAGYDDDDFPIVGELRAFARFKDQPELRVYSRPVVVNKKPEPPTPIELLDDPTFLRVRSRQPIRLVSGGSPVHVRLQWNGKPALLRGSRPKWQFGARCLSLGTFPRIAFGFMNDGRLTFILYPPNGLITNITLDFEVTASGPDGKELRATFRAIIADPAQATTVPLKEPRLIVATSPKSIGQRKPPYDLKYIKQSEWQDPNKPCFQGGGAWTPGDAGCFLEPTSTQPLLLLFVNEDMELLKTYREFMIKKRPPLDPKNITMRANKYISHIAFHLYQMYNEKKDAEEKTTDGAARTRSEHDMRAEINRVGTTLMKLM